MSLTTEPSSSHPVSNAPATAPADVPDMTPVMGEERALSLRGLLLIAAFGLVFAYFNYIPLFHSDIWGHVNYGNWMHQHGKLPTEDPFTPLAEGVPAVCTAWLSQVIFGWAARTGGPEWISHLFALCSLGMYLFLARACYIRSGSLGTSLVCCGLAFAVGFTRHAIVRPETFGGLCFAILMYVVARALKQQESDDDAEAAASTAPTDAAADTGPKTSPMPWVLWIVTPLLFAVWANLHGSFMVGVLLLACCGAGRVIQVFWKGWQFEAVLFDKWVHRWLITGELALGAMFLNPYGADLLVEVLRFSSNVNLKDIVEWYAVKLVDFEGVTLSAAVVILMVLLRTSRAKLHPSEVLMWFVFAAAVAPTVRMIGWLAPVFAFAAAPHVGSVFVRLWNGSDACRQLDETLNWRAFQFIPISLLVVWMVFALTPIGLVVLPGTGRKDLTLYSRGTPLKATTFLNELYAGKVEDQSPPTGQVWNPQWWGDWLVYRLPPQFKSFMTTNAVHLAPRRVWREYMSIANADGNWVRALDRYGVQMVIVDKERQIPLAREVRKLQGWEVIYDETDAVIVRRIAKGTDSVSRDSEAGTGGEAGRDTSGTGTGT